MGHTSLMASAVLLSLCVTTAVTECECPPKHLQTIYCKSDIVFVGKYQSVTRVSVDDLYHKFIISKIFKGRLPFEVFEYRSEYTCDIILSKIAYDEDYLVWGSQMTNKDLYVTACDLMHWEDVNNYQKLGLSSYYQLGCNCTIDTNENAAIKKSASSCPWHSSNSASIEFARLYNTSACLPVSKHTTSCKWRIIKQST